MEPCRSRLAIGCGDASCSPRSHLAIDIRLTAQVAAAVKGGVLELGFVEGEVDAPIREATRVARDPLVLGVGPTRIHGPAL